MTSWKTSLGGALAGVGTFLWGAPVALQQLNLGEVLSPGVTKYCILIGLAASALGVFFIGLFGRDNGVTSEQVLQAKAEKEAKKDDGRSPLFLLAFLLIALLAGSLLFGCAGSNARLEPGGAYAPTISAYETNAAGDIASVQVQVVEGDYALFVVDSAFTLADTAFRTVSNIERANRKMLWQKDKNIKRDLDQIRTKAWEVVGEYTRARTAYKQHPTPAGLDALSSTLKKMEALSSAAEVLIPKQ